MEKHPDHTASFEYPKARYIVKLGDTVIVDTSHAILLKEVFPGREYSPIPYFPIGDVRKEFLKETDHHTLCPLKGEASYYSVAVDGNTVENSVWYYPEPLEYVKEVAGYVSFYPGKFAIVTETCPLP